MKSNNIFGLYKIFWVISIFFKCCRLLIEKMSASNISSASSLRIKSFYICMPSELHLFDVKRQAFSHQKDAIRDFKSFIWMKTSLNYWLYCDFVWSLFFSLFTPLFAKKKSQGRKKELYRRMTDKLCSPKGDYRSDDEPCSTGLNLLWNRMNKI